ncbi:hypothetical protein IC614_05755 [Allosphingosinicella flava]|uniref:Uncharacterized protein n=1 Tax=Allosphingosinicella flava TaxID=2771430 RepID=A0A7T2GLI0_9SPHN|nr:Imm50 family immunity protein [Sphingosinicella flava]QPQ56074.1 hypothetical protein IC614_05755 [Sphingosinicella flava]
MDDEIPGMKDVMEWFGYKPVFHDAIILAVDLRRDPNPSLIKLFYWRTKKNFRRDLHALVTFYVEGIESLDLEGWNDNHVSDLDVKYDGESYVMDITSSSGFDGEIRARKISVSVEPLQV